MSIPRYEITVEYRWGNHEMVVRPYPQGDWLKFWEVEGLLKGKGVSETEYRKLESILAAERARRIKVEEVVNWITARPEIYQETDAWDLSAEYRAQYPRVEKETK